MNKRLDQALSKIRELPDDEQSTVADLLFEYLDPNKQVLPLSPEQLAEIERCLSDEEPLATDEEVRETLERLTK